MSRGFILSLFLIAQAALAEPVARPSGASCGLLDLIVHGQTLDGRLDGFAGSLHQWFERRSHRVRSDVEEIFPATSFGQFSHRVKEVPSIRSKLSRSIRDGDHAAIETFEAAKNEVRDGIGAQLILRDPSERGVEKFVRRLVQAVSRGEIVIHDLKNYRGPGGVPYLTNSQIRRIVGAARARGHDVKIVNGTDAERRSGYTALHLNLLHRSGVVSEFQVRGGSTSGVADIEHFVYDIRQEKPVPSHLNTELSRKLSARIRGLSPAQMEAYLQYLRETYLAKRHEELGSARRMPSLPRSIQQFPELQFENLQSLIHYLRNRARWLEEPVQNR